MPYTRWIPYQDNEASYAWIASHDLSRITVSESFIGRGEAPDWCVYLHDKADFVRLYGAYPTEEEASNAGKQLLRALGVIAEV